MLVDQPSALPTRKVLAGGIGGALAVIVIWAINRWLLPDAPLPPDVAAALTMMISSGAAYMARERAPG